MPSEGDNDSSAGSTVLSNTANDTIKSTVTATAVNDSADDDAVAKKRIDIFESTFPHKLYHILQNPDFKDIITWMPNGRSWKMIDRKEFTKRVLPLFFRHQKFSSFKRQLSGWEFLRGVKECSANEYHHPLFMRDQPELLLKMRRRKQNRNTKATCVSTDNGSASTSSRHPPINISSPLVNNGIPTGFGSRSSETATNGLPVLGNQSHLLQNFNSTAQQVLFTGLSGARLQIGLPLTNENQGSNSILLQNSKLQISDYLNAYRASNQRSTSNQILGSSITVPTPAEIAMMAEIKRLREQNNAHIIGLLRSGVVSSTSAPVNRSIDTTPSGANRVNSHIIADYISRVNTSSAPPLLTNIAMACLNQYSGSPCLSPSDTGAIQASRHSKSP